MLDKSSLTTKCTSFSRTQTKFRSKSNHQPLVNKTDNLINISLNDIIPQKKVRRSYNEIKSSSFLNTLFTKPIVEQLLSGNNELYMQQLSILLSQQIDEENLKGLSALINMSADIMLKIKHIDLASQLYNQSRILQTYTMNHSNKSKAYIGLSKCCTLSKQYQEALMFLKKALQYTWFSGNEHEFMIYEKMALNYFYLGMIEDSHYFHERGLIGISESSNSPIKQFSNENLKDQLKKIQFRFTTLTPLLLQYLNLPILTIQQLPPKFNYNTIRPYARKFNTNILHKDLISHLFDKEFELQTIINTPKYQKLLLNQTFVTYKEQKPIIRRKQAKPYVHTYDIQNQTIYKLPYEEQVQHRLDFPYKVEDVSKLIRSKISSRQKASRFALRAPILINHDFKEDKHYEKNKACLLRQLYAILNEYQQLQN